jgi:hypothetical protein
MINRHGSKSDKEICKCGGNYGPPFDQCRDTLSVAAHKETAYDQISAVTRCQRQLIKKRVVAYCLSSMLAPKSRHVGPIWPHTVHLAVTSSRRVRGVGQRSTKPIAVTNHGFVGCPTGGGAELTKATTLGSCVKRSEHGQRRGQHMEPVLFPNVSTTNMCCCWIATPVIVVCIAYGASLMLWCARIVWVALVCGASLINMGCLRVRVQFA